MSDKGKAQLVPKRRFPEFQGAASWKLTSLGDASTPVTERVGERKLTPVSISAGIGFVPQAEKFGRDISGNQYQLYTLVRDGDFVYNKGNSLKFPEGCVYLLRDWAQVAAPNVFICFRLKDGYSNGFFQNCFESNAHGKKLKRHITSGARSNGLLNISKDAFFGVAIPTPTWAEQQKIADCLSSLDELIAAQARKVDALKTHKKGLIQQIFPGEGETQPRARFSEFTNQKEWEAKPLSAFCKIGDIDHKMPPSVLDGIPYVMTGNFFGINGIDFECAKKISIKDYEQLSKKIKPEIGDIVIARYASVGAVRYIETNMKFLVSYSCAIIKCNRSENSKFLYYFLQSDALQSKIGLEINMSSQKNIGIDSIKKLTIFLPDLPEQHKVAGSLAILDALITAETQKLETLKTHKKGLVQQLFPSAEAVEA
jgi:type I restriction enzyme, S subunit